MSADLQITPARPEQAAELSAMLEAAWHATYDHIMGEAGVAAITARWHAPQVLLQQMVEPDNYCLVALDGSDIIGNAYARPLENGMVEMRRLYVMPQYQGRGLGETLLNAILEHYPGKSMHVEVQQENTRAIAFYKAMGFVVTGRSAHCGGDSDVPSFLMERRHD